MTDDRYKSNEQRAREQAYQEYLKLRESSSSRGNYVKDDTLYGAYFPKGHDNSQRQSSKGTPYGNSEMKRKQEKSARDQYLEERANTKNEKIAKPGRINKADLDKPVKKRRKKESERGLKAATGIILVLVLVITGTVFAGIAIAKSVLDNVGRIKIDPDAIGINPGVEEQLSNYRNIALLGIDSRDMDSDSGVRSDAIIIASINEETGEIKLFSVYRDTMLDLGEDVGLDKVTHAYYYGGAEKVLYTLNKNLDINIKEVAVVNWKAVADTVDALGGIEIEILDSEISEMNKYIHDTQNNIGGSDEEIEKAGKQTLNGVQAVTYARIRKDALTGDYRRNERMKIVVKATFEKAMQMDVDALKTISNDILPQIKTNMSSRDMLGLIMNITSYEMTDSVGWPYVTRGWTGAAWYGPPVTLNSNVTQLHEEFFAQPEYVPTDDVQSISANISATTGYY